MKIKTKDLMPPALNWAVAKCEGVRVEYLDDGITKCLLCSHQFSGIYDPVGNWAQGGPIIEQKLSHLFKYNSLDKSAAPVWCAVINMPGEHGVMLLQMDGPTPLITAMRCFVTSKLGDEVDIPEELIK